MKRFYTFAALACACMAAWATSPSQPVEIVEISHFSHDAATVSSPAHRAARAAEADYTEWESLGVATLGEGYNYILTTLNAYKSPEQEEYSFENTTEIMVRHLRDDANVQQFKFCKFWGYNDIIADYDAETCFGSIAAADTGIPVPGQLAEAYGCTSLEFVCSSLSYSEGSGIFTFAGLFLQMGGTVYGFNLSSFGASLPDANHSFGFSLSWKSGGTRSTDTFGTFAVESDGVDHVRYITRHSGGFRQADIAAMVKGECEYTDASDEVTIRYNEGHGRYSALVLAMDADNRYLGMYKIISVTSNIAPEGIWESIGTGVWHHPYDAVYYLQDFETGGSTAYEFPADKLQWDVEMERRTDTDREIYRVVNPYSPSCGLAETFDTLLDMMYPGDMALYRPDAFRTDDTFWFVFDVTDPSDITFDEYRPNGLGNSHFAGTEFSEVPEASRSFENKVLTISNFAYTSAGWRDLVVELPGADGIEGISADLTDTPAEYFDLQGRRVAAPSAGIYLRRRGATVEKVCVK